MMNFSHEIVKVDAAFALIRHASIKHIHQETFPSSYATPEIQALGHLRAEQAASQKMVALCFEIDQLTPKRIQIIYCGRLCGIK
jgi:hypothetical protein